MIDGVSADVEIARRKHLGRLVEKARVDRGWTAKEAAGHADIDRRTWAALEAGRKIQDSNYRKIQLALGWASGFILGVLRGDDLAFEAERQQQLAASILTKMEKNPEFTQEERDHVEGALLDGYWQEQHEHDPAD